MQYQCLASETVEGNGNKFLFRLYVLYLTLFYKLLCTVTVIVFEEPGTTVSLLSPRYQPETGEIPLWIGNESLPQVKELKYLGVLFASNGRMSGRCTEALSTLIRTLL